MSILGRAISRDFLIFPNKIFSMKSIGVSFSLFTIVFSAFFLLFFLPFWVSNSTHETATDLGSDAPFSDFNCTSCENPVNNSTHFREDGDSSRSTEISSADAGNVSSSSNSFDSLVNSSNVSSSSVELDHVTPKRDDSSQLKSVDINSLEGKNSALECDITKGRWVIDESYPLYSNSSCPFIDEGFNCEGNGRLDRSYMKWRWQPEKCVIDRVEDGVRFNASRMLELIRGKRLVFVGDSLNRNQWESMLCLLIRGVIDPTKVYEAHGRKITKERGDYSFKFEDYKCTVEFYVSHYLVHESKMRIGSKRKQTLRIDTIDKGSSRWKGADILVFNTAHWWSHSKTKAGKVIKSYLDSMLRKHSGRAISTWATWVDKYINPHKTQIFFRSSAPSHFSGGQWNTGGHCREASNPINQTSSSYFSEKNMIVEEIISKMRIPVRLLNITEISSYRPDAHPSIYGRRSLDPGVEDCSHWCLPGVPDTWNQLLYHHLHLRAMKSSIVQYR